MNSPKSPATEWPDRVREVFSCQGLRLDYFAVGSPSFEIARCSPDTHDLGREYLSLAEHEHLVEQARREARAEAFEEAFQIVGAPGNYSARRGIEELLKKKAAREEPRRE